MFHTSGRKRCCTSPAPGPWFSRCNNKVKECCFSGPSTKVGAPEFHSEMTHHPGARAGLTVVPAVGDLTDDVKGFLEVDSVRHHLQRQSDVSVPWCLCEKEGRWNRKTRIENAVIWWVIPFFAADSSEASPSPRDWSSRRCPACRSPSRPWWPRPSLRTLASASGSTDTAGCPWAAGRTFSQRCTPWKRNTEWRRVATPLLAAWLWCCAAFTPCLWMWPRWALWRCTSWTAPERLSP